MPTTLIRPPADLPPAPPIPDGYVGWSYWGPGVGGCHALVSFVSAMVDTRYLSEGWLEGEGHHGNSHSCHYLVALREGDTLPPHPNGPHIPEPPVIVSSRPPRNVRRAKLEPLNLP